MSNYVNYKKYNDFELLYLVNEGNELALTIMFEKYEAYIAKLALNYVPHYDFRYDDLIQEGRMILFQCILRFNEYYDSSFFNFFSIAFKRRIIRLLNNDYYNSHTLCEDATLYQAGEEKINLNGKMFFNDPKKIKLFDECIIGEKSIREYAKKYNLSYDKVYYLYQKVIEELREILKND